MVLAFFLQQMFLSYRNIAHKIIPINKYYRYKNYIIYEFGNHKIPQYSAYKFSV